MALKARKPAPARGRARPGTQPKAEASPATAAREAKPTFGKAAPKKVVAGQATPKAAAKARKPAAGKNSGSAVRSAASIAVGAVVVTARGVASLAASVVGRRGPKGKAKAK